MTVIAGILYYEEITVPIYLFHEPQSFIKGRTYIEFSEPPLYIICIRIVVEIGNTSIENPALNVSGILSNEVVILDDPE